MTRQIGLFIRIYNIFSHDLVINRLCKRIGVCAFFKIYFYFCENDTLCELIGCLRYTMNVWKKIMKFQQ